MKRILWDALMELIAEKPFPVITVRDVCDKALVHRTTFYRHFEDKDDLLRRGIESMVDDLTGDSRRPAREILAELSPRRPPDQLVRMFVHAAAHERAYRAMLGHGENSSARRVIGEAFAGFLLPRIRSVAGEAAEPAVPAEIISQFAAGALMNLLEWWLEANRPYPPEAMAVYSMCLCMDGCYGVLGVPHRE
jgi:AcrR family transcriptional regulator